jgi:1-acyl-sn-glycerol-3-phosphate acyltransferase
VSAEPQDAAALDAATAGPAASSATTPFSPRRAALPDVMLRPRLYRTLRVVVRAIIRLILDVRVGHRERVPSTGPVLLAGNHRGFLDGPLVAAFVPRQASFLAKSELFRGWVVRPLGWLGQIPVDRGRPDREALRRAIDVLAGGGVLGMFPEGTRGAGELDSVQHGIAYVALRVHGVRIVPVACLGTERALPKGARLPRWRSPVDVVFGEPFTIPAPANPRARRAVADAAELIRQQLAAHVSNAATEARR